MAEVVEQKPIGIPIATDGTFSNTELLDGKIQLKASTQNPVTYPQVGLWTSKAVDIGDSFKEYGKIIATSLNENGSTVAISTRSSDNGTTFSPWQKTEADGTIVSPKGRYIQVRLELRAGFTVDDIFILPKDLIGSNKFTELVQAVPEKWLTPTMTGNTTPSGIAFSASAESASYAAWKAFDKLDSTTYLTANGVAYVLGHLGYIFPAQQSIEQYRITCMNRTNILNQMPKNWQLQGSNDTTNGTNGVWTDIDSRTNEIWSIASETRVYKLQKAESYKAYRIKWSANNGNPTTTQIAEVDFGLLPKYGVQLKHDYKNSMVKDNTWSDTGELHRVTVNKSDFLNIKRMEVK